MGAAVVVVDAGDEPAPFVAGSVVVHEEVGAVFACPVVVGYDVAEGDVVLIHEGGAEFGGAVEGGDEVVTAFFAHFDADGEAVAGSAGVGVASGFIEGDVLDGDAGVGGEVPCVAEASGVEGAGVLQGVGAAVFSAVDGDEFGTHPMGVRPYGVP